MNGGPRARLLPDGRRLHLHHGPIDLVVEAWGPERQACYEQAVTRFETLLDGLVSELPRLRTPNSDHWRFEDPVAERMAGAARRFGEVFITPMVAVAGAVAEEILAALIKNRATSKAYVNNGGDIAFHLEASESVTAIGPAGHIEMTAERPARGLATSGAGGRSHSFGIADAVTVIARSAADADAAATLIANAVDLPGHPAIARARACDHAPDSDLGKRLITVSVGKLSSQEIALALDKGVARARDFQSDGKILEAALSLRSQVRVVAEQA